MEEKKYIEVDEYNMSWEKEKNLTFIFRNHHLEVPISVLFDGLLWYQKKHGKLDKDLLDKINEPFKE